MANVDWEIIARDLYEMLDDVDTASDIAKGNDALYRNLVARAHKSRFRYHEVMDPEGNVSQFNQPPTEAE